MSGFGLVQMELAQLNVARMREPLESPPQQRFGIRLELVAKLIKRRVRVKLGITRR